MNKDKFQILRDFAKSNEKPDKTIYEYVKEVLDMNSAYAKENQKYKETIDKAIEYIEKNKNQKLYTGEEIFDTYSPATDLLNILEEVE